MPVYSNIASTLARQGPKSFPHGCAQSLIAATHPQVYASQNRPGLGFHRKAKVNHFQSYNFQNVFHNSAQTSSTVIQVRNEKSDAGLDAYFEAWKRIYACGETEKEWTQFQFAKCIEWKPSPSDVENEVLSKFESEEIPNVCHSERECSTDVNNEPNVEELVVDDAVVLSKIDAALGKEIKLRNEKAIFDAELSVVAAKCQSPSTTQISDQSLIEITHHISSSNFDSNSVTDQESQAHTEYLTKLSETQRYAEIPNEFKSMLDDGIKPTVSAYNALLDAAIHLPAERIHVVPKALEIYSDMLRRKVLPNTATYDTLLKLLSSRTIEVNSSKQLLEEKCRRFGGMDVKGKFMLASSEVEYAILTEDDRIDLMTRIFDASIICHKDRSYPPETYEKLIAACLTASRTLDMIRIFEHMKRTNVLPMASTFSHMIDSATLSGELDRAVDYYNEYKKLAIDHDNGVHDMPNRQDHLVYASLVKAYVKSDRMKGALKFYNKIIDINPNNAAFINDSIIEKGFVQGLVDRGMLPEALIWAEKLTGLLKISIMTKLAIVAADLGHRSTASTAFAYLYQNSQQDISLPTMAMLALSVREGDILAAQHYWQILSRPGYIFNSSFIEPTAMFAVAMIGSGKVLEGLMSADQMFSCIRSSTVDTTGHLHDEVDEGLMFIHNFMATRGIQDPRLDTSEACPFYFFNFLPFQNSEIYGNKYDPYALSTDYKGSSIISDELDWASARGRASKFNEALNRFQSMRQTGRHPRYIIYAKLISTAAREKRANLVHEILEMARIDVPLLQQYPLVRYGWISILDAMVGSCLILGDRVSAAKYHQELLNMGAAPTANTFGLYITTLKDSTKTFDEASDAISIFHRAKTEGVEPSSFLYNALIGKLGKARRIDDCLFYFSEMRSLGIRPTSVTYGTIVNALCRVSDEKFAEELFEEMESMPNYKARPAPYNSLMQFFLTTKREKSKVMSYYERMKSKGIEPTSHTYKLLVDAHATLEPINMAAAEAVLDVIRSTGQQPDAVHYSSLIHAKGCVMHDLQGAKAIFNSVMADPSITPQACLFQALFEAMVANHLVSETELILNEMPEKGVSMTPYIANTLIHGWASEKNIKKAESIYAMVRRDQREPSTYDAMTRAYLAIENRLGASAVIKEMMSRNYPGAVSNKICELLGNSHVDKFV